LKITIGNTYIEKHQELYAVHVQMPDGSRNYLHSETFELQTVLEIKDLIQGMIIRVENIRIHPDGTYYRLKFKLHPPNSFEVLFHSRKLNLQDAVYERMQLLVAED